MKKTNIYYILTALIVTLLITNCDNFHTIRSVIGNIDYSIQVNNQAASRAALSENDTIELFIRNFQYCEDAASRSIAIIAEGWDRGRLGGQLNNSGWYSVSADLQPANHQADIHNGRYSSVMLRIEKLRVNGTVYDFPADKQDAELGAHWNWNNTGCDIYPDNFHGIVWSDQVRSLKTILIVEPDITGVANASGYDSQGLSTDPFKFIKVEGRINE